jgi:CRP-like cAMP-binding protein
VAYSRNYLTVPKIKDRRNTATCTVSDRYHALELSEAHMANAAQSQNLLLAALPAADFELLRPNLQTVDMPLGLVLVRPGAIPKRAYFPHRGVIASGVMLSDGNVVETRITGRDGALGAAVGAGERTSFTSAVIRLEGEASTIDYQSLQTAIDASAALRALLARHEAFQQAMADQSVACNAIHPIEARLARRLMRLRNISGHTTFNVTQDVLAEMLGVQRNAVSIVAHAMREANIIRYSRGQLEIVDFDALSRVSCECYAAVTAYRDYLEGD